MVSDASRPGSSRRGAGAAYRNRLESGRWQKCQPRVQIPPPPPPRGDAHGTCSETAAGKAGDPAEERLMTSPDLRRYRWSRAYGLRILGLSVVLLAVVWLLAALSGFQSWSLVVMAVAALIAVGCLVRLVVLPPLLLEVSSDGYRLHHVRGGGVRQARWSEVRSVEGGSGAEGAVMSITLENGRATLVPLVLLGAQGAAAEREFHDRLNAAFGYRRLGER